MSFDLVVWYEPSPLTKEEAAEKSALFADGEATSTPHPTFEAFFTELSATYPSADDGEGDAGPPKEGAAPWTVDIDRGEGHALVSINWARAEETERAILELSKKHGLVCYDP